MQLTKRINQLRAASEINIFSCKMWRREAIVIACLLVLLLSNSALVIVDAAPSLSTSGDRNCSAVLAAVEGLGVPKSLGKGPSPSSSALRICNAVDGGGDGCCSTAIESRLLEASHQFMERQTRDSLGKLATVLGKRSQKFNDYFKELLVDSKKEFHAMFKRTYGAIYEQNSYVFSDLFTKLEMYYTWGQVNLSKVLDEFFNTLYQKMFTVLNSQFSYDDKYLFCVSEHMNELKPFGDVPDKLSVQIKRSFVATRTYAQVLAAGAEVVKKAMNMKPSLECAVAVTRMRNCSLCSTGSVQRPCPNFCVDTMQTCLRDFVELDAEWNSFVDGIDKVSERLLGPFNVVMVVEPINIKISEAIMNFQERNKEISGQVFQGCGRPLLGRRRRAIEEQEDDFLFLDGDTPAEEVGEAAIVDDRERVRRSAEPEPNKEIRDFEPVRFSSEQHHQGTTENGGRGSGGGGGRGNGKNRARGNKSRMDYEVNMEPTLDKLIKDIRQRVRETKKFWSNLPFQFCNNEEFNLSPLAVAPLLPGAAVPTTQQQCWNGQTVISWDPATGMRNTGGDSVSKSVSISSSTSATAARSKILDSQLFALRTAAGQLRNAYNGQDVEWSDDEENDFGGSGAGSGNNNYDEEDDTEDADDSGSGQTGWDPMFNGGRSEGGSTSHSPTSIDDLGHTVSVGGGVSSSTSSSPVDKEADVEDRTVNVHVDGDERVTQGPKSNSGDGGIRPTSPPSGGTESSSGSGGRWSGQPEMSIARAVATYFFPIFMAWFGGIFSILL